MANNANEKALENSVKALSKSVDDVLEKARMNDELSAENEKFIKLFEDKSFVEKFNATEDATKVKELFAENGVDISVEEINEIKSASKKLEEKIISSSGELDDNALEGVAGGNSWNVFDFFSSINNRPSVCEAVAIEASVVCKFPSAISDTVLCGTAMPDGMKFL